MTRISRRMRKMRKMMVIASALMLAMGLAIGGTVAYLVATTGEVTNTFTVGSIKIELDEAKVDKTTGKKITGDGAARVDKNDYVIIPGDTVDKDPTVTVEAGSEKCFVFVSVTNELVIDNTVVGTPNIDTTKWTSVGTSGNKTVYAYTNGDTAAAEVDATTADKALVVFTTVTIADTVNAGNINTLQNKTIVVEAYAHQSENTNAATAQDAALAHFGING